MMAMSGTPRGDEFDPKMGNRQKKAMVKIRNMVVSTMNFV
jgi:hypothetical protein